MEIYNQRQQHLVSHREVGHRTRCLKPQLKVSLDAEETTEIGSLRNTLNELLITEI